MAGELCKAADGSSKLLQASPLPPVCSPLSWPSGCPADYDAMVAGAGLGGVVIARMLAARAGWRVLLVDQRRSLADVLAGEARRSSAAARDGKGTATRRASAFLRRVSRCDPCHGSDIACIHGAEEEGRIVERLLEHPAIDLLLGVELGDARQAYGHRRLVRAGPIGVEDTAELGLPDPETIVIGELDGASTREAIVEQALTAFDRIVAGEELGAIASAA